MPSACCTNSAAAACAHASTERRSRQPRQHPPPVGRHWRQQQRRALTPCLAEPHARVVLYDAYDQQVPYEQAWRWQKDMVDQVAAQAAGSSSSDGSSGQQGASAASQEPSGNAQHPLPLGALVLLQHPPVYTLGAGSTEGHLKFDPAAPPLPLYRTERGGEVTYHGPGQLVMYPILDLRRAPLQPDLHWYLRCLEEVVVRALDAVSGLRGERIPGLTGVWVDGHKVAAIGVRASRWVTYHGLALNVTTDLSPFQEIVPCGIADRAVASVAGLEAAAAAAAAAAARRNPSGGQRAAHAAAYEADPLAAGFKAAAAAAAGDAGGQAGEAPPGAATAAALATLVQQRPPSAAQAEQALLEEYRYALLEAFEEVFGLQLSPADAVTDPMAARLRGFGTASQESEASQAAGAAVA